MPKPIIIGIAGSHSGVGKTSIAVALLKDLTSSPQAIGSPIKKSRWGAIKYTKTAFYSSIIDDDTILSDRKKDTGRLLSAGAENVLWVQSPESEVHEVLLTAIERLSHLDGIILEGNTAIEFLRPDIVIFIEDQDGRTKPSAKKVLRYADIIIKNLKPLSIVFRNKENEETTSNSYDLGNTEIGMKELSDYIVKKTKQKNIEAVLLEKSTNSRIMCRDARKIAEELMVSYSEIGRIANKLKIKIKNCELGCF